jgi:hypothetical protein
MHDKTAVFFRNYDFSGLKESCPQHFPRRISSEDNPSPEDYAIALVAKKNDTKRNANTTHITAQRS